MIFTTSCRKFHIVCAIFKYKFRSTSDYLTVCAIFKYKFRSKRDDFYDELS